MFTRNDNLLSDFLDLDTIEDFKNRIQAEINSEDDSGENFLTAVRKIANLLEIKQDK